MKYRHSLKDSMSAVSAVVEWIGGADVFYDLFAAVHGESLRTLLARDAEENVEGGE